ncbi:MAG: GNAT family N-acetyltransferase [Agromyces sp.]
MYSTEPLPRANRVADVHAHPEHLRWYYRIMVDRERNIAVGSISFHAAPDERGMIEVGLGVAAEERGNGFASEALDAMWTWAIREPSVRFLRYTVAPTNEPSLAIIRKFGFPLVGEQIDDEDGLELIFELAAAEYPPGRTPPDTR